MSPLWIAVLVAAAVAAPAAAEDNQAGMPLTPTEAAGPWTVQTQGHAVCVLALGSARAAAGGYALRTPASCAGALPDRPAAWQPTPPTACA